MDQDDTQKDEETTTEGGDMPATEEETTEGEAAM